MTMLNQRVPRDRVMKAFPGVVYCFYGRNVYDVTGFIHPGGMRILQEKTHQDITRYFEGAYGFELTNQTPYKHSQFALSKLEKMFVGTIVYDEILIDVTQK